MAAPMQQGYPSQNRLTHQQHYPPTQMSMAPMSGPTPVLGPATVDSGQTTLVDNSLGAQSVGNPAGPQPIQPQRDFNTALLCRIGQETVQEIVTKTTELFQMLKILQLSNGTAQSMTGQEDRKAKLHESLRNIGVLFKRLRRIYDKCNENCAGMEYTHIESLVPMKDEVETKQEDRKVTEAVKYLTEEHRDLVEQVVLKNRQLKEVIDNLRNIVWDINTMLAMRRP